MTFSLLIKKYLPILTGMSMILVLAAFHLKEESFDILTKKIDTYVRSNPQEKIYVHLDKPYYAVGDTIWLKAYIANATNNRLSNLSKIVYIDLINDRDSIVQGLTLPVAEGMCWSSLSLSDSLSEGNYRLRAYTTLMQNTGPDFFYDKTLKIGNNWSNKVSLKATYSYHKERNGELGVASSLQFANNDGVGITAKELTYEVVWNTKVIKRGSGKTNSDGKFALNFISPKNENGGRGRIIASLTMPDKKKLVKEVLIEAASDDVDVQFFPESGNLIEGFPGKITFKAVNPVGKGVPISGSLRDQDANILSTFNSAFLGMGNIILTPEAGNTYMAHVKFADGSEHNYQLPKAQKSGYAISVNNIDSSKIQVKIYVSKDLLNETGQLKLLVQHNGILSYSSSSVIRKQIITATIPKKDLTSGINQILLISDKNLPICERLVFVKNNADLLPIKMESNKAVYKKREQVRMSFSIPGASSGLAAFSVAVTNADIVVPDLENESNIFTTLLLTSDLKGYVEKPNHYFLSDDVQTTIELDNLMLTQGWTRYSWKDLIENKLTQQSFKAEQSFRITGTINRLSGKPLPYGKVSLYSSTKGFFMVDTVADASGHFVFDNLYYTDSTNFLIQGKNAKDKLKVEIKMDPNPAQTVTKNKNSGDIELNVNDALSQYIRNSNIYFEEQLKQGFLSRSTVQLNEVKITKKWVNPAPNSANLNGPGVADKILVAKDFKNCFSIPQCLPGRIPGLMFSVEGIPSLMRMNGKPMAIFIDGMKVQPDILQYFPIDDVESVELLNSAGTMAIYGSQGGAGILLITTKRGNGSTYNHYTPWIVSFIPKGYTLSKEFYSPKYAIDKSNTDEDLRTTVYWNPNIISDASGKGKFDFYTSDQPGNYRAVLEGINLNGEIARQTLTFQVK
ncbi:hypothetical protein CLV32_2614 [Pedobacter duraquae]|uniref:TonB-dependent SusC/RagA subfamily outer membrane receptor n=2 Tax=Pedobacter duraquae TaxID=425511 RepID=A0A4V3C3C1_9SPHI|nr:hypothetical protein CLV32_2614 [Pedobacter duraquae]